MFLSFVVSQNTFKHLFVDDQRHTLGIFNWQLEDL